MDRRVKKRNKQTLMHFRQASEVLFDLYAVAAYILVDMVNCVKKKSNLSNSLTNVTVFASEALITGAFIS